MDKISGIIPSSPRVLAVDLKDAAPVRPGTPSFGRPQGVSSLNQTTIDYRHPSLSASMDKFSTGGIGASDAFANPLETWKSKDLKHAAMVQELSDRFFGRNRELGNLQEAEGLVAAKDFSPRQVFEATSFPRASRPAGFKTDELGSLEVNSAVKSQPRWSSADEESGFDVGEMNDIELPARNFSLFSEGMDPIATPSEQVLAEGAEMDDLTGDLDLHEITEEPLPSTDLRSGLELATTANAPLSTESSRVQPPGLYPKGSFINYSV